MKLITKVLIICILSTPLLALAAKPSKNFPKFTTANEGKSIAIISLSANNYGNSLQGWNSSDTTALMGSHLNTMLELAEKRLAKNFTVIPAKSFATKDAFLKLAGEQRNVGVPTINKKPMPLMSENRKEMVKARVSKDKAIALAKLINADFIMVIYSEWAVKTGNFVPTSKALTKNVVSVFNAEGKQVYAGRKDKVGAKTIGAGGLVTVDENSIIQWVNAYEKGLELLFAGRKK